MLLTIIAFIVAILLLVSLHELGHLIVARLCGVKVLRFSIGFGKPFFCHKRADIEWCLAPIPLGGYVKMVDTREGDVSEAIYLMHLIVNIHLNELPLLLPALNQSDSGYIIVYCQLWYWWYYSDTTMGGYG